MSCAVHVVDTEKEKYTSLYIKWNDLNNENKKLKEELDVWVNPTGDVVMNREAMMLYEASQEENKELKEKMEAQSSVTRSVVSALKKELADARKLHSSQIDILDENKKLKEEVKELKEEDGENGKVILFLKGECCAGGWAGRDNDPHEFANDVKQYFKEYKKTHKIENVEELYKEWAEWSCIEDQLNPCEY